MKYFNLCSFLNIASNSTYNSTNKSAEYFLKIPLDDSFIDRPKKKLKSISFCKNKVYFGIFLNVDLQFEKILQKLYFFNFSFTGFYIEFDAMFNNLLKFKSFVFQPFFVQN